jgi:hypothetical protein
MIPQKWLGELSGLHRNYEGAVERAERTPSIVAAGRLARALGPKLSEMLRRWSERRAGSVGAMDTRNQPSHDSSTLGPQGPSREV